MPVAHHAPAHTLVCLRHGQSRWNLENRFTGWTDVNLTSRGEDEARRAAALLTEGGYDFDACWTSLLTRAIRTLWITLETMDRCWLPVSRSWRLNERHYGALQGMNKAETTAEFGEDQVFAWRRGYAVRPPALEPGDERYPGHDRRYAELPRENLPRTESLADTVARVLPLWETELAPAIRDGKRLLVAAHGNSLRALVKHLDGLSEDEITQLNIPTGMPLVYELDHALKPLRSFYLGDPDEVAKAAKAVADQAKAQKAVEKPPPSRHGRHAAKAGPFPGLDDLPLHLAAFSVQ